MKLSLNVFFYLFFCLLLTSCAAFIDDCDCERDFSPLPISEDIIKEAQSVPVYTMPMIEKDQNLSLIDVLDISLAYQLKSRRAHEAAKSACYSFKSALSTLYPTLSSNVTYLIDDLRSSPPGRAVSNLSLIGGANTNTQTGFNGLQGNPMTFNSASSVSNGTFRSTTSSLLLTYLLLDFGGRQGSINSAWHFFREMTFMSKQSVQDVLQDSLQAYFNYLMALENFRATQENLTNSQKSFEMVSELYKVQYATVLDTEQLRTSVLQYEGNLKTLEGTVKTNHGALAKAMGINVSTTFDVKSIPELFYANEIEHSVEELIHAALVYKPELAAYKEEFLKKQADLQVLRSAGLPTITTDLSSSYTKFYNGPTKNVKESIVGLSLNVPIFQGFYYTNQNKKGIADINVAFTDWKLREEGAMLNVWSNYYNYVAARASLEISQRLYESALQAFNAASELYKSRLATIQDLLNTQNALANARLVLVQNKITIASSLSALAYSIGILRPGILNHLNP